MGGQVERSRDHSQPLLWLAALITGLLSALLLVGGYLATAILPFGLWESPRSEYLAATIWLLSPGTLALLVSAALATSALWRLYHHWPSVLASVLAFLSMLALVGILLLGIHGLLLGMTVGELLGYSAPLLVPTLIAVLLAVVLIAAAKRRRESIARDGTAHANGLTSGSS